MNIYLFGARSRYDFFQELADQQVHPFAPMLTLSRFGGDGIYPSSLVPLYTTLMLPQEEKVPEIINRSDHILVFDQIPFGSASVKTQVKNLRKDYPNTHITVVLDHSGVDAGEVSLQQGERDYQIMGCATLRYQQGDSKEFLQFKKNTWTEIMKQEWRENIATLQEKAPTYIKEECGLVYLLQLQDTIEDPVFLEKFTKFQPHMVETDVNKQYVTATLTHCFESEWESYLAPYWRIYQEFLKEVWIWKEEEDFQCFMTLMQQAFLFRTRSLKQCPFSGKTSQEYLLFLNKHHPDVKFKEKLIHFFSAEVEEILLKYVQGKLEGLKHEVA